MELICNPAGVLMDGGKRYTVKCTTKGCKQPVRRVVGQRGETSRPGRPEWLWVQVEPCMHTDGVETKEDQAYTTKWRGPKA